MDAIQDLVEQRLDHSPRQLKWLLVGLGCSVELYNVLNTEQKKRVIVVDGYLRKVSIFTRQECVAP